MLETLWKMTLLDQYTTIVIVCMVVSAYSIIRAMTHSTALAILYTPVLAFGALAGNYLFRISFYNVVRDKDSNVVAASATGVMAALFLMLIASRIAMYISAQKRRKNQSQLTIAGRAPTAST